jgi:hypothetical protein
MNPQLIQGRKWRKANSRVYSKRILFDNVESAAASKAKVAERHTTLGVSIGDSSVV